MEIPKFVIDKREHRVLQRDIFDVLDDIDEVDVAYFDPPYGSANELMPSSRVRYASYYHIWKTICLNDTPELVGVAKRRKDTGDTVSGSVFEEYRKDDEGNFIAMQAIAELIKKVRARTVILSYNNNGRATLQAILSAIKDLGLEAQVVEINHKTHVMATMKWTNAWLNKNVQSGSTEYLFIIEKRPSADSSIIRERDTTLRDVQLPDPAAEVSMHGR